MKNILNYFPENVEYPEDIAERPLPFGTLYSYVSSTFLNGFINYVDILKAYVAERYHKWDEPLQDGYKISITDPPGSFNWVSKICYTKNELFGNITIPRSNFHSDFVDFQDDVIILAQAQNKLENSQCFYLFWYDRDCSDCLIGRFVSGDSKEDIIKAFDYYIKEDPAVVEYTGESREIPLHYFNGWLKG